MNVSALVVSALIVEFFVISSVNILQTGRAIYDWYKKFGLVAVLSDVTSVVIGIMLADFIVPHATIPKLLAAALVVQVVHDVLFFFAVVRPIPSGTNMLIDIFKQYSAENSYTILFADALIITLSVLLYSVLLKHTKLLPFLTASALYAITYIIYTVR